MSDSGGFVLSSLDYWRLSDELNIIQASLLVSGHDPSSDQQFVEDLDYDKRPEGYEAVKTALSRALMSSVIAGKHFEELDYDINGNHVGEIEGTIDLKRSIVLVSDLKKWLAKRGMTSGFFFPKDGESIDFLDLDHPNYSPKLAATVNAWLVMESEGTTKGKTVKQSLEIWLRLNAKDYGLCDEDGKPNEKGIEECAKVANWQQKGGAPKTPS